LLPTWWHLPGEGKRAALTFHSMRHTCVSLLKDSGFPDAVVMALVGHESVAMSARYTHIGLPAMRQADQWFCGKFIKGPTLKGTPVNQDGSTADLLPFLVDPVAVIERIPMRLDPYSKQLQELVEVTVE
jgi:integrase-like protein